MKLHLWCVAYVFLLGSSIQAQPVESKQPIEIPELKSGERIIQHRAYALVYSETHEQAKWVAYELTRNETVNVYKRTNRFVPDPKVSTGSANGKDYAGSGYDRGHLAPAADMSWSAEVLAESFYFSNMSPQTPEFNRGIWKKLETQVRTWAIEYEAVVVVTGPVLRDGLPTIGPNRVSVPEYYYKVILDYREPGLKGIGFVLPNASLSSSLSQFAINIDSVESITGINFFPGLPDEMENALENNLCIPCWSWKPVRQTNTLKSAGQQGLSVSVQCGGITKKGLRCKRMTRNRNGRCQSHGG